METSLAVGLVIEELKRAKSGNGDFHSAHEGYAVILEELDELWDEIKRKRSERSPERMRREAVQVAAMGLRFLVDLL